jgi:hypothetical protein
VELVPSLPREPRRNRRSISAATFVAPTPLVGAMPPASRPEKFFLFPFWSSFNRLPHPIPLAPPKHDVVAKAGLPRRSMMGLRRRALAPP